MPSRGQSKAESFLETTTPEGSKQTSNAPDGIGFIIIDGSGALFGGLTGGVRQILHRMSVELPRKPGKGGQSAFRQSRHNYVTKVASMAALVFMTNNKVNIAGLVVAGSSDFKSSIVEDEKLDPRLRSKVTLVLDVPYGGEKGFNHAIKMASSIPRKVQLEHEAKIIKTWLDAVRFDTGKACFGMDSVLSALDCGAVERLLLWENLHHRRITFQSASGEEETVVLTDAQSREIERSRDATRGRKKEVVENVRLADWLVENATLLGYQVEHVTDSSAEGSQFCKGWGGIGAFVRFRLV